MNNVKECLKNVEVYNLNSTCIFIFSLYEMTENIFPSDKNHNVLIYNLKTFHEILTCVK